MRLEACGSASFETRYALLKMRTEFPVLAMRFASELLFKRYENPSKSPFKEGRQSAERRTHGPCLTGTTAAPSGTARLPALHHGSRQ
jgi:hypothetical protein